MNREPLLGQLHRDLACAIALTVVEDPHVVATLESITLHDGAMRPLGTVRDWLQEDDPLDATTRAYLSARREASMTTARKPGQNGWAAASTAKVREQANSRAREARDRGRALLAERGVLAHARRAGLRLIGLD